MRGIIHVDIILNPDIKPCAYYRGLGYDHRLINQRMLALEKTSLTRENKIE